MRSVQTADINDGLGVRTRNTGRKEGRTGHGWCMVLKTTRIREIQRKGYGSEVLRYTVGGVSVVDGEGDCAMYLVLAPGKLRGSAGRPREGD